MLAVFSDVHGNLEALEAVLADSRANGAERLICLGDVVGYGPDPSACLTRVRTEVSVLLRGNHDAATLGQALGFNPAAKKAIDWTRSQIRPGLFSSKEKRRNWRMLREARMRHIEGAKLFVHGSPLDPVNDYVDERDADPFGMGPNPKIQSVLQSIEGTCFVGHTHTPGVIGPDASWASQPELDEGWPLDRTPAVVNVGSVGQPRDGDPRACYVLVNEQRVWYHRVSYDVEKTAGKMERVSALTAHLSERLHEGR